MLKFMLRIPDDLHLRLTAQAETGRRSLNAEMLHLLEVALTTAGGDDESPGGNSSTPAPLRGSGPSPRP
ncbi:toxin-antitoxin system HicB family antitoxin [Streptomyces sp. NPDC059866]|uniref:toxin-antitoxin system HicB family antitoxin n=1 Tax=Streptomyces sp. NPDC059866 TaxID=3346978 RepID=UPI003665DF19